ncbi:MAG: hypothetical protein AABZ50_02660 [Pseudomonadota bacterium]
MIASASILPPARLTLLVPGLTGFHELAAPRLRALEALLARAERSQRCVGVERQLFECFQVETDTNTDLPVAAVTRVLDLGVIDKGWWLRADPVHLTPDRDRLILAGPDRLALRQEEAEQLAAEVIESYRADGWVLKAPRPDRWYLRPPTTPSITTTPILEVEGRDIAPCLPKGPDGKAWHTVLNEIQILLHSSKVNEARERSGQLPVNSLWFWGGGILPRLPSQHWVHVWADDPVALSLARLAEVPASPTADSLDACLQECPAGDQLMVLDAARAPARYGDGSEWTATFEHYERDWFAPLLAALREGRIAAATLIDENGATFSVTTPQARRWWRWRRPLAVYC